jgi:hypothetical protein
MRIGRLVWRRRVVSGLAGVGGPVVVLRGRWWTSRLRVAVAVLAGVPLLSVGLAAGAAAAPAVSAPGPAT